MSKKRIHIDDLFRRGLGNMQLPVDGSDFAAMQRMLAAAKKRRRRRIVAIWLVAGLLLLGGGITGGYIYTSKQYAAEQELAEHKNPPVDSYNGQAEQPLSPGTDNTTRNNPADNATGNNADETNTNNQPEHSAEQGGNDNSTDNRKPENGRKRLHKQDTNQPERADEQVGKGDDTKEPAEEVTGKQEPLQEPQVVAKTDSTAETKAEETAEVPADSAKEEEVAKQENNKKTKQPSVGSPFSIGISAGPVLNTFAISNNTNYGRIRNQGDELAGGINAAIMGNYRLNRWMFSAGLGVNSIGGRGSYQYSRQVWDSIPVLNPGGQIIGYFRTNYRDSAFNFSIEHRFNYVTLPIFASYNMPVGNKWGVSAGAGAQVQYLAALNGKYINPSNLFTFDLKNDGFIRRWNVAGSVNLGVYYNLNRYFTINTVFTYSHFFNSMLGKTAGVGIRPRNAGLEIGLKYNLLKPAE